MKPTSHVFVLFVAALCSYSTVSSREITEISTSRTTREQKLTNISSSASAVNPILTGFPKEQIKPDSTQGSKELKEKGIIPVVRMRLIADDENKLSFEDVQNIDLSTIQTRKNQYIISKNTVWIIIDLSLFEGLNADYLLSFIGNAREINLYYHTINGDWELTRSHLNNKRQVGSLYPALRLPYSKLDAPVYIQLIEPVCPLIVIEKQGDSFNRQLKKTIFHSIILGSLLIILLINLFRWIETRERIFGLYVFYILSLIITILALGGNNMIFLFGRISPYLKLTFHIASIFFLNLMASLYAISFLELKKNIPKLYKVVVLSIFLLAIPYTYLFFDLTHLGSIGNVSIALTLCLIFTGGIVLIKRGHSYATYYVIAYALFAILHIAYIFIRNYDYALTYTSPMHISLIGFFLEALLLNISLNRKIGFEKKIAELQYMKSQSELLQFKNAQNTLLEENVRERTGELEESNSELRKVEEDLKAANSQARRKNRELSKTIDALKNAQSKLIEVEKMASLGVLSAGIGHEINNPLNYIKGGMSGLSRHIKPQLEGDPKTKKFISIVNEGVDRASSIVKSLAHFSRESTEMNEECDINQILKNCLVILENKLKHKANVLKDFSNEEVCCTGNEGRLHQAFLNVISNAEQAISSKGEIEIRTFVKMNKIMVTISDNGAGIEKKHLNKIMDPFFTTKDPGEGTGLGLSITYKIIEDHGGKIKVKSELGKGTSFEISFPLIQKKELK